MSKKEAIEIKNLTKNYQNIVAVNNLDLTIHEGELFALLGVNGAGKTTTIKMLTGLVRPTSGEAYILGYNVVKETNQIKKLMNLSPQETAVAPNLSVEENLAFIAGIYEIPKKLKKRKLRTL